MALASLAQKKIVMHPRKMGLGKGDLLPGGPQEITTEVRTKRIQALSGVVSPSFSFPLGLAWDRPRLMLGWIWRLSLVTTEKGVRTLEDYGDSFSSILVWVIRTLITCEGPFSGKGCRKCTVKVST